MSPSPGQGPKYEVNIEGTLYEWQEPTITVSEIRTLAGLDTSQQLIEVDLVDNTEPPTYCRLCKQKHGFGRTN